MTIKITGEQIVSGPIQLPEGTDPKGMALALEEFSDRLLKGPPGGWTIRLWGKKAIEAQAALRRQSLQRKRHFEPGEPSSGIPKMKATLRRDEPIEVSFLECPVHGAGCPGYEIWDGTVQLVCPCNPKGSE